MRELSSNVFLCCLSPAYIPLLGLFSCCTSLSNMGFAPATIRARLTSFCLLSELTGLLSTRINYNYISSFLLLLFFLSLHLFKTTHCHFIYMPESCTDLSLDCMIYPCHAATLWIMCSNCSLFCFNWVFWKGDSGQPLLSSVLLVFIATKTGTCGVREIWQHRSSQEANTRSRSTFFQARVGGSDTCAVDFGPTEWPGSLTLAHQCALCQSLHNSSCKVASDAQLLLHWTVNLYIWKPANICSSVNLSIVNIARPQELYIRMAKTNYL